MDHASILRQIALVSYGTRFLRNKLALEEWFRHGIFFGARLLFRQGTDNSLLADDFTTWLGILGRSGAVRLSLHLAAEFDINRPGAMRTGDYAVLVHYVAHYQIWIIGDERAAWLEHPLLADDRDHKFPVFPDAASYGGDLDSYWYIEERLGLRDVPRTNWKALTAAVAADLDIRILSTDVPGGPILPYVSEQTSWAKLPLFPYSHGTSLAHALLATLDREKSTFSNDTNFKNENSYYKNLDAAGAATADAWGARLDRWLIDVQLRCANEY